MDNQIVPPNKNPKPKHFKRMTIRIPDDLWSKLKHAKTGGEILSINHAALIGFRQILSRSTSVKL